MTTEPDPHEPAPSEEPSEAQAGNGTMHAAGKASVRSGLARRRNPALVLLGDFASNTRRLVFRDPLSLFLLVASIGLAITFAALLGDIKPSSSGRQVPLSTVQGLAKRHAVNSALLLDHDSRVEVTTNGSAPPIPVSGALPPEPVPAPISPRSPAKATRRRIPGSRRMRLPLAITRSRARMQSR